MLLTCQVSEKIPVNSLKDTFSPVRSGHRSALLPALQLKVTLFMCWSEKHPPACTPSFSVVCLSR